MIKFGQVQAYDKTTGEATIVYMRPDACAKCGACGGGGKSRSIRLKADCAVGDWVKVELPDGRFLGATALAYALPLACFLLGLFLGYSLSGGMELWALLGSAIGLSLSAVALRLFELRLRQRPEWTPASAPSTPTSRTSTTSAAAAANNPLNAPRGGGKSSPPPPFFAPARRGRAFLAERWPETPFRAVFSVNPPEKGFANSVKKSFAFLLFKMPFL